MVKLEEVTDEHFATQHEESEWDTDDESDASSTTSSLEDETLYDRLSALKDIIPASRRSQLTSSFDSASSYLGSGLLWTGKAVWILSSSALLLGVPWMLAYADDQQMMEMEQQMKMQQSANEFLTPGQPGGPLEGKEGL